MDERIEDIEVKLAYLEKRMSDLDGVVCDLGDAVAILRAELREMRDTEFPAGEGEVRRPEDEVPPHY